MCPSKKIKSSKKTDITVRSYKKGTIRDITPPIKGYCSKLEWPFFGIAVFKSELKGAEHCAHSLPGDLKLARNLEAIPAPSIKGRGEFEGEEVVFVPKDDWETLVDFLEDLRAYERFERIKDEPPEAFIDLEELKRKALKNRIKEARRSKGFTQVELAGKLGCKQSYISKIEKPDYRPRFETLKKVAEALGCGVEDLI